MSCCDESTTCWDGKALHRRSVLQGAAMLAGVLAGGGARAAGPRLKLAFCSQLLCIIPYEVARSGGHFEREGLQIELVYTRGGNAAMQALVGGAVDYAATSLDVALQAYAHGAAIRRFATTGRLPLFAVATAPKRAADITDIRHLEGHSIGVSALGNADHALALYLLKKAGADPAKVRFATLGTNLLEALRQGQVDAGMVQEPALTLVSRAGGRVLANLMDEADAHRFLGGDYEFMGVAVREDERDKRRDEMAALGRALKSALAATQTVSPDDLVTALPRETLIGADLAELRQILARYRSSLYPTGIALNRAAEDRVAESLKEAGLLKQDFDAGGLYDTSIAGG
ncbi:MAG TPA: ABC transporter substrate-binding protein [Stellaceae bacterium]|nr:ABC transporter substrate-binding protein [Stellaceae bacterium]